MNEILLNFIRNSCEIFLNSDEFVVKNYLENDELCYFIIVAEQSNIIKLEENKYRGESSFINDLIEAAYLLSLQENFNKTIKIDLEVLDGY